MIKKSSEVRLIPSSEDDAEGFHLIRSDETSQLLLLSPLISDSLEDTRRWIARRTADPNCRLWTLKHSEDEAFLGFVQLVDIHWHHRRAEMGIAIVGDKRERGYGSRAILALMEDDFFKQKIRKLCVHVLPSHKKALSLYQKVGFRKVGLLTRHYFVQDTWHDVVLMEWTIGSKQGL